MAYSKVLQVAFLDLHWHPTMDHEFNAESLYHDGKDVPSPARHISKDVDVFVEKEEHRIHYKTLTWPVSATLHVQLNPMTYYPEQFVSLLMIAEIVSNGMLSLPSTLAVVGSVVLSHETLYMISNPFSGAGIVPGVVLIVFLGIWGLYTAKLLVDFKINHPEVHNMGS
jgi:hypothetical protein